MKLDAEPIGNITGTSKKYDKDAVNRKIVGLRLIVDKTAVDYEAAASAFAPVDTSRLSRNVGEVILVLNNGLTKIVKIVDGSILKYAEKTEVVPTSRQRAPRGHAWRARAINKVKPKMKEAVKLLMTS